MRIKQQSKANQIRSNQILAKSAKLVATVALLSVVAACGKVDRLATVNSAVPFDYRERHPIVLTNKVRMVKVFSSLSGISQADRERVADLAKRYKRNGRGPVVVEYPARRGSRATRKAIRQIRSVLAKNGARGRLRVRGYEVIDPELAQPIRVSFVGLAAKVARACGDWPEDLASGSSLSGWNNKPYWNQGCAYQSMLAAQTSDPRDLVGPRGEAPPDVSMRMRAIDKVRKGEDPGTNWKVKNTTISTAGGN